ncbi:TIGR03621 family F420-dependent LLM class oxidoreductase [Nocardia sp. CA-135953]|uniref:TIGR03621 family F420-dependent LLM class oxidoreductase n=1 Tax=Nocardia sp. CA-135953 TaxID=3239978 RepID=UPI003D97160F
MTYQAPLRFGVNTVWSGDRAAFVEESRKAEKLGFDVIGVADHLGFPAPFPALVLAAEATERVRVNTFVLNAGFYNPTLLAREVATVDRLTGGRLELGLGAGYVEGEFATAGIPFGTARARIAHLAHTVTELKRLLGDAGHAPQPVQDPHPPLLIAGAGDRLLELAATEADVISFSGATKGPNGIRIPAGSDAIAERVAFARAAAAGRVEAIELNLLVQQVARDVAPLLDRLRSRMPDLTPQALADSPVFLFGTARDIADQIAELRNRLGLTYFTTFGHSMELFAEAIELLR